MGSLLNSDGSFRLDARPHNSWITAWSPLRRGFRRSLRTCRSVMPISSGSLLLRDQFFLGLLQVDQPVSLGLGHQQLSFVHPPGWTLSIGHFYFAQIGHYYFAATTIHPAIARKYFSW
jgi:hypothetical protein